MLVLSRKVGQTIVVGENLVLQIVKVQGGRVKLAIQAPDTVRIRRGELPGNVDFAWDRDRCSSDENCEFVDLQVHAELSDTVCS